MEVDKTDCTEGYVSREG